MQAFYVAYAKGLTILPPPVAELDDLKSNLPTVEQLEAATAELAEIVAMLANRDNGG